jgi:hypothetical protein
MSVSAKGISEPVLAFLSLIQLASSSGTSSPVSVPPAIVAAVQASQESLETSLFHTRIAQNILAAAVALWVYDYTLTIDDEIDLLWKRGVRMHVKILFFLVSLSI